jgi:hypothetical protein
MKYVTPAGVDHLITYKFTDLFKFRTLAELPLNAVTFSKCVNAAGPWAATLNIEDLQVQRSNWLAATDENKTALWVDIDGTLVYGGICQNRKYTLSKGQVALSGTDFCGYTSQRRQAANYTSYTDPEGHKWSTKPGAAVLRIAYYVLKQAIEKKYSIPIRVVTEGVTPEEYWQTFSAPIEQQKTLAAILSELQGLGYLVGIDYACDVFFENGRPVAQITLSYPRRGGDATTLEVSSLTELEYDGDGSGQGNIIAELAGGTSARTYEVEWKKALEEGYPLYELVESHSSTSESEESANFLAAYAAGDLSMYAYPTTAPVATLPLFGTPAIFDLSVGADTTLLIPKVAGAQPGSNPRFPEGLKYLFRSSRIDVTIPDEGVPTMALTLNTLPNLFPVQPPTAGRWVEGEGGEPYKHKEKEREEKEKEEKEKEEKEKEEKEEEEEGEKLIGAGTITIKFECTTEEAPGGDQTLISSEDPLAMTVGATTSHTNIFPVNTYKSTVEAMSKALPGGTANVEFEASPSPVVGNINATGTEITSASIRPLQNILKGSPVTVTFEWKAFS